MPSKPLTGDFKHQVGRFATSLLARRCAAAPIPVTVEQLETLTFQSEADQNLMQRFRRRYPNQFLGHNLIAIDYQMKVSETCELAWLVKVFGDQMTIMKQERHVLYRSRDPEAYDEFYHWLKDHEMRVLETWLAEWLIDEALDHCGTTAQLHYLWPQLLHMDRSGRAQELAEGSRPRDAPQKKAWRVNWMSTVSQWLAEGAVMADLPRLAENCCALVTLKGGKGRVQFDRHTADVAIRQNLKSLRVDPDSKRLPIYGQWSE